MVKHNTPTLKPGSRSQTLRWGLEVLFLFSNEQPEWGITEIAQRMGLQKSRIYRAVKTLEEAGLLRRDPLTRRYSLGLRTIELGSLAARRVGLFAEARFHFAHLSAKTKATVYVCVWNGDADNVVVDSFEGPGFLRFFSPPGTRIPWNRGASSKLIHAYMPREHAIEMIRKFGLPRHTERTITDETKFLKELARTRKQGYAVSDGEGIPGVFAVSAPLLQRDGTLLAALAVVMVAAEVSREQRREIISMVVETASEVTRLIMQEGKSG